MVTDTNALVNAACAHARIDALPQMARLAELSPTPLAIAGHIPDEVERVLPMRAEEDGLAVEAVWQSYEELLAPNLVVVDLAIRDHLRPDVLATANDRVTIKKRPIGDPDDLPTVALAAFLAPATVVSQDRLFFDFELAQSFDVKETAIRLIEIARFDATADAATVISSLVLMAAGSGLASLARLGRRSPALAVGLLLGAAVLAARVHPKFRDSSLYKQLTEHAWPILEAAARALEAQQTRIDGEVVITDPAWYSPSVEAVVARHLFRSHEPLTSSAIFRALRDGGWSFTRKEIYDAMVAHPAFVRVGPYAFRVGRSLA